jgi:hypothetical protein
VPDGAVCLAGRLGQPSSATLEDLESDPTMIPYPIETTPKPELDHEPVPILVYCPDEGGWHTAIWWEARGACTVISRGPSTRRTGSRRRPTWWSSRLSVWNPTDTRCRITDG